MSFYCIYCLDILLYDFRFPITNKISYISLHIISHTSVKQYTFFFVNGLSQNAYWKHYAEFLRYSRSVHHCYSIPVSVCNLSINENDKWCSNMPLWKMVHNKVSKSILMTGRICHSFLSKKHTFLVDDNFHFSILTRRNKIVRSKGSFALGNNDFLLFCRHELAR